MRRKENMKRMKRKLRGWEACPGMQKPRSIRQMGRGRA